MGWKSILPLLDRGRKVGARDTVRRREAKSLYNLGTTYYSLGDYPQARNSFRDSLAIFREISDRSCEAESLFQIGGTYLSLEDYPQALDSFQQALPIYREIGDREGEDQCHKIIDELHCLKP